MKPDDDAPMAQVQRFRVSGLRRFRLFPMMIDGVGSHVVPLLFPCGGYFCSPSFVWLLASGMAVVLMWWSWLMMEGRMNRVMVLFGVVWAGKTGSVDSSVSGSGPD